MAKKRSLPAVVEAYDRKRELLDEAIALLARRYGEFKSAEVRYKRWTKREQEITEADRGPEQMPTVVRSHHPLCEVVREHFARGYTDKTCDCPVVLDAVVPGCCVCSALGGPHGHNVRGEPVFLGLKPRYPETRALGGSEQGYDDGPVKEDR